MATLPYETFIALTDRIRGLGVDPGGYDVFALVDTLLDEGLVSEDSPGVESVSDVDFLRLLGRHKRQDQTALPCPEWCGMKRGHPFHSTNPDTGGVVREHIRDFGPWVSLCTSEEAVTGDGPVWEVSAPYLCVVDDLTALGLEEAAAFAADLGRAVEALRSASGTSRG